MTENIKCPKCGSEDVTVNRRVTTELPHRQQTFVDITYYCGSCGHFFESE